jgi:hypothetical protein
MLASNCAPPLAVAFEKRISPAALLYHSPVMRIGVNLELSTTVNSSGADGSTGQRESGRCGSRFDA